MRGPSESQPLAPAAETGQHRLPAVLSAVGGKRQADVEPVGQRIDAGPLGPLHEDQRVVGHLVPSERLELLAPVQPEQIGMDDRKAPPS